MASTYYSRSLRETLEGLSRPGADHAPGERHFRRYDADADRALLPDAIVRQQCFVFVDLVRKVVGKRRWSIEVTGRSR